MNYLIYMLSLIGFLVLPGLLLAIRLLREKIMPWWLLILLVLILSWGLLNSGVHSYYEYLFDLIESTPDPSQELLDEFGSDGAKLVFTLFFGWLYGCVYLVPWLLIYQILRFLQRKWSASSNRDTHEGEMVVDPKFRGIEIQQHQNGISQIVGLNYTNTLIDGTIFPQLKSGIQIILS